MVYRKVIKGEESSTQEVSKIQVTMTKTKSQTGTAGAGAVPPIMKKQVSNISGASKGSIGSFANKFAGM